MTNRRVLGLLSILLLAAAPLAAQTFRGTIAGTVSDQTGAVVPGAKVTVKNEGTGLERTAETDDTGYYVAPELPIGAYSVTVEKAGFRTAVVTGIRVEVAAERRVDVTLEPGAVEQRTEVVATVPLVETTTNTLGGTLEARQVEDLPINGRDFGKLLVLVPGASGDPVGNTDFPGSFGLFSTNGNRGRANNFLIDGTDMNDGFRNLPAINEAGVFGTPATILPLDAIAEARVLTNFETEYGRNGGSVVNIVTKSGTNDWHGSGYYFYRNENLNARNFFNNVGEKDRFRNHQFGGSLGGPLRENQTFFYMSYEGQREDGAITTLSGVPTLGEYIAAVTLLGGSAAPCSSISACIQGNAGFLNPVILNLYEFCAGSGACSGGALPWPEPTPGLGGTAVAPADFDNRVDSFIVKIDHNFDQNNLLTGRYFFGDSDQSFPLGLAGGGNLPRTNTFTPTRVQLVSLSYVKVYSPTRVNEIRFGYNRFAEDFLADDREVFGNPAESLGLNTGVTNPRDFGLTTLSVSGFAQLGSSPFSNPRGRVDTNWHVVDGYSWKRGRHDWKFGLEFRRTFVSSFYNANFRGKLNFASLADFLDGAVDGGRIVRGDTQRGTFQNSWAGYVQDSFRWTPRFTLNWGLRWDYYGVLDEEANRFSRYDPAAGLIELGAPGFSRLYDQDLNNFGPRFSVAWDPWGDGKTVFRAGWGVFYDAFSQDFFIGQIPWNTFNTGVAYNPVGASPVLISFVPDAVLVEDDPVYEPVSFLANSTDLTVADPDIRTPYIQNFNINVQRELWGNSVLQVAYVGSLGRKLFRTREINQSFFPGGARPFDDDADVGGVTAPNRTPFIVNQVETSASSSYHSLQVSFTQRKWRGWSHAAHWTWGHSIDTASDGIESVPNQATPDNNHNPAGERANSNFDTRHRFVWSWIYDVPKFTDRAPKLTQGWRLTGVLTLMSGHPFSINFIDDFDGDGFYDFILRPDLVGDPFAGRDEPDRYLNLSAFAVPCILQAGAANGTVDECIFRTLHYGSLGRNAFTGPDYKNFDISVIKNTGLSERVTIQLRADFYNFFNHSNFASPTLPAFIALAGFNGIDPATGRGIGFLPILATPDTGIGYPALGGGAPRNIQFAAKIIF